MVAFQRGSDKSSHQTCFLKYEEQTVLSLDLVLREYNYQVSL